MSVRPKAPGEEDRLSRRDLRDIVVLVLAAATFGALLAIPHPVTVLAARVLGG